jgi:hypothetical protein
LGQTGPLPDLFDIDLFRGEKTDAGFLPFLMRHSLFEAALDAGKEITHELLRRYRLPAARMSSFTSLARSLRSAADRLSFLFFP